MTIISIYMNIKTKTIPDILLFLGLVLGISMLLLSRGLNYHFHHTHLVVNISQILALLLIATSYICKAYDYFIASGFKGRLAILAPFIPAVCVIISFVFGLLTLERFLWFVELYLVLSVVFYLGRFFLQSAAKTEQPANALLISFVMIILAGASMLLLPGMHRESITFTDAVFTSTSAVCVTGLAVCDTATEFTRTGQFVIFGLIQIGGLGIMIFGALFAVLLGSKLSMKEAVAIRDIINEQNVGDLSRKVIFICLATFAFELAGMALLMTVELPGHSFWDKFFFSMFHSVSAFCNAGFSLQSDSLVAFRDNWQTYFVICPLIIVGGLGFPVLLNLYDLLRYKYESLCSYDCKLRRPRLMLHSKLVLYPTAFLLIGGTIILWLCSFTNSAQHVSFLDCFFNSVTLRTAGFNTIDFSKLDAATRLVMIAFMSVGGSPASTAGGIKTVTIAIIVLTIISTMKKHNTVDIFHRSISVAMVRRSLVLAAIYALLLWLMSLLLIVTENNTGKDPLDLFFETASALGTVGLSTGLTPELTTTGKWVIIIAMLAGRLGPLTLLTSLTISPKRGRYKYPNEPLVIG